MPRTGRTQTADGSSVDYRSPALLLGCVLGAASVGLALRNLPPRGLPEVAVSGWVVLAFAGLGEIYARGRRDLLVRGRLFALASGLTYAASLGYVRDPSGPQLLVAVAVVRALVYVMIATTGLDVAALANARAWGIELRPVPTWARWCVLGAGAVSLITLCMVLVTFWRLGI